jgi:hypothetical protein
MMLAEAASTSRLLPFCMPPFPGSAVAAVLLIAGAPLWLPAQTQPALRHAGPVRGVWEGVRTAGEWPTFMTLTITGDSAGGATLEILGQNLSAAEVRTDERTAAVRIGEGPDAVHVSLSRREARLEGWLRQGNDSASISLQRVPDYPRPAGRVEAWTQDIDALTTRFLQYDRSFSPAERASFIELLDSTRRELPQLHDNQVIARLASAIAIARNAHTRLYLVRNATALRRLPVRLWWFSDGLRVVRVAPEHTALLGCRVDDIEGFVARQARDMVAPAFAGNPQWVDYKSVYSLTTAELLHGFGVARSADSVTYGISDCAAAGRVVLKPMPLVRRLDTVEAWWDLSPQHPGADSGWTQALAGDEVELPLYLRQPTRNYWFEYDPRSRILYFQYNRSQNVGGETVAQFGERLLAALQEHRPRAFVMDVRFNTGGNLTLSDALLEMVVARTDSMRRFVITSRSTFSAGISAIVPFAESGSVTIVGEPVGDDLDMWAEGGNVVLPNSRFEAHFANGLHSYSPTPCPSDVPCRDRSVESLRPHLPVNLSWDEYRRGRNPTMERIREAVVRSPDR